MQLNSTAQKSGNAKPTDSASQDQDVRVQENVCHRFQRIKRFVAWTLALVFSHAFKRNVRDANPGSTERSITVQSGHRISLVVPFNIRL
jgi:hypothetical protein